MGGFTVWFTGLPASGKSTLARLLERVLRERGLSVVVLDGDEVRQKLSKGLGYSKEDRDENIRRIAYVAKLLTRCGAVAICCAISPYRAIREEARSEIGRFIEIYTKCPIGICQRRDPKGLYAKALRGEIKSFTGVSDPYEEPLSPEVVVETDKESPEQSLAKIVKYLEDHEYLPRAGAGFVQIAIPKYLFSQLQREAKRQGFSDVSSYVTHLLGRRLDEERSAEVLSADEKESIKERLRSLGYLD